MNYCQNCGHEAHCNEKCLQDYGESAVENIENLAETNLKSGKMICNF